MTAAILRHVTVTIALTLLALGGLVKPDGAGSHGVRLVDTATMPGLTGTLALNQVGSGTFIRNRQFAGYEITLPAGDYLIRAWGETPQGGPLDTVLFVYGPKAASGNYTGTSMARNDDAKGQTESSALRLALNNGAYRIVVTTYMSDYAGTFHVVAELAAKAIGNVSPVPDAPRAPG